MHSPGTNQCPVCHAPLEMNSQFCGNCGTYLGSSSDNTETKLMETLQHVSPPSGSSPPAVLPGPSQQSSSNQQPLLPGPQVVQNVSWRKKQAFVLGALAVSVALVLLVIGGLALADRGKSKSTPVGAPQSTSTPSRVPGQQVTPSSTRVSEPTPTPTTTPMPSPTPVPRSTPSPTPLPSPTPQPSPTSTPTPEPTLTPTPTPAPAVTPTPTAASPPTPTAPPPGH
jgi:zinc-ribbon domain